MSAGADAVIISGTPTAIGAYSFTLRATDSTAPNLSASQQFSGNIAPSTTLILTAGPASLLFNPEPGMSPQSQSISIFTGSSSVAFTATVSPATSWLSITSLASVTPGTLTVSANPAGLPAGSYTGQILISAQYSAPATLTIPVTLVVAPTSETAPLVTPQQLFVSFASGAGPDPQWLFVSGPGAITASAQTSSCGNWLEIAGSAASTPVTPGAIQVVLDPSQVPAGTCTGQITVSVNTQTQTIPVTMVVSAQAESMELPLTGLDLQVSQGGEPVSDGFPVLDTGISSMDWTVETSTTDPGNWLTATPDAGSSTPGSPATVAVSANPQGLDPGQYFGTIQISAPGGNTSKSVTVSLTVLPPGQAPALQSVPAGIVLLGSSPRTITLINSSNVASSFTSASSTTDQPDWLNATPSSGTVAANGILQVNISARASGGTAGAHLGTLRFAFNDGTVRTIRVQSIAGGNCSTPSSPAVVFQSPEDGFQAIATHPVNITVQAVDCNGVPVGASNGAVEALVRIPDQRSITIPLTDSGNGLWTGTWVPLSPAMVSLTANAVEEAPGSTPQLGQTLISGQILPVANPAPAVSGIANGASYQSPGQASPGSWVVLSGFGFSSGKGLAQGTPYPNNLLGTQVFIGGTKMPLYYVSPNQINALIPQELPADTFQQLVVMNNGAISAGSDVLISDVEPGLFSANQQGSGQGAVLLAGTSSLAAPAANFPGAQPASRGQYISIYCTGLGAVSNAPPDGQPAGTTTLSQTILAPQVTIGGLPAMVSFSGLAPQAVGLYQINVQVPEDVAPGVAVPLVVAIGGVVSNSVSIAVSP